VVTSIVLLGLLSTGLLLWGRRKLRRPQRRRTEAGDRPEPMKSAA